MALISVLFFYYIDLQRKSQANIKRMDFWGFVMLLNILALLGVILAFWVQVNLIDTLWCLLALTPVTLFVFSKGLSGSADCEIRT